MGGSSRYCLGVGAARGPIFSSPHFEEVAQAVVVHDADQHAKGLLLGHVQQQRRRQKTQTLQYKEGLSRC